MAYVLEKKYWLKSNSGQALGKYLNVYGNEQVSNLRNVSLYTKVDGANSQGWFISSRSAGLKLLTALDTSYGADHYNGSTNLGNCDIYQEYGSDTDSVIVMEPVDASQDIYRIKLANNSNRYLTAKTNDVRWEASNGAISQQWKMEPWNAPSSKLIAGLGIRSIYNQKYTGTSSWIKTYGCAVCAACSASAFYKGSAYTLAQAFTDGLYTESNGVSWAAAKYFSTSQITGLTQTEYLTKIREQISLQKPVLVHVIGSLSEHWVVAYEYSGAGTTTDQILVLDSVHNAGDQYGVTRTLNISMDLNFDSFTIKELRTTSKK